MKKILCLLGLLAMVLSFNVTAFAAPLSEKEAKKADCVEFEITGGIDYFDKTESTFDTSRTITGLSEDGSVVDICVYTVNTKGDLVERDSYTFDVGVSGIFSQDIDLYVGENVIIASSTMEGKETTELEATIRRKKKAIKVELENSISLPGEGLKTMLIIR